MVAALHDTVTLTERKPTIFDLVGEGGLFPDFESIQRDADGHLEKVSWLMGTENREQTANLLLRLMSMKAVLDSPMKLMIDGELCDMANPITGLPLYGRDVLKARSGPFYSLPLDLSLDSLSRDDPEYDRIMEFKENTLAEWSRQGVNFDERYADAALALLAIPHDSPRPVSDGDMEMGDPVLYRNSVALAYQQKYDRNIPPSLLDEVAEANWQYGGQLHREDIEHALSAKTNYTSLLKARLAQDENERHHHVLIDSVGDYLVDTLKFPPTIDQNHLGEMELCYGYSAAFYGPEFRDINGQLLTTTHIYETFPENLARQLLGDAVYEDKGEVELMDTITDTKPDLAGVINKSDSIAQYLAALRHDIQGQLLPGLSEPTLNRLIEQQRNQPFNCNQLGRQLMELCATEEAQERVYFLTQLQAVQAQEYQDCMQGQEDGRKTSLSQQQQREGLKGKVFGNANDVGGQRSEPGLAGQEMACLSYLVSLPRWEVHINNLESIHDLTYFPNASRERVAQQFAHYLNTPGRSYRCEGHPIRRQNAITTEEAYEKLEKFEERLIPLNEFAMANKPYFEKVAALGNAYDNFSAASAPDAIDDEFSSRKERAKREYDAAFANMQQEFSAIITQQTPLLAQKLEALSPDQPDKLITKLAQNLAAKTVESILFDRRRAELEQYNNKTVDPHSSAQSITQPQHVARHIIVPTVPANPVIAGEFEKIAAQLEKYATIPPALAAMNPEPTLQDIIANLTNFLKTENKTVVTPPLASGTAPSKPSERIR